MIKYFFPLHNPILHIHYKSLEQCKEPATIQRKPKFYTFIKNNKLQLILVQTEIHILHTNISIFLVYIGQE